MFTPWTVRGPMLVAFVVLLSVVGSHGNDETAVAKDYKLANPYGFVGSTARQYTGRQIFDIRKNGFRVDMRIVPSLKSDSLKNDSSDGFPAFPTRDIGLCIINFSLACARKRFGLFLGTIKNLNEIYLMGQEIKLVKTRALNDYASDNHTNDGIERNVNDFFDTFALRITLPRWNGKREKNQIDLMFDEPALSEGRGKGGGGGGGGGGGKGGGGKCKMMMMAGLMMLKMKVVGIATIKGMMMAGMSLMISMAMLMHKFMKGGGGGGYGGGGGGGHYKEIVLLTKSSGGGGGGGGGGCCGPSDSYGAPPPSSYGVPSGGGGYGGGGGGGYGGGYGGGGGGSGYGGYGGGGGGGYGAGGWGRSFGRRMITTNYATTNRTAHSANSSLVMDKSPNSIDNSSRGDNTSMNPNVANWNSNQHEQKYNYLNENSSIVGNGTDRKPLGYSQSNNYDVESDPYQNVPSKEYVNESSIGGSHSNRSRLVGSTNHVNNYDSNARPVYADEWQASEDKVALTNLKRDVLHDSSLAESQSSLRGI